MNVEQVVELSKAGSKLMLFIVYCRHLSFIFTRVHLEKSLKNYQYVVSSSTLTTLLKELTEKDFLKKLDRGKYTVNMDFITFLENGD